MWARDIHYCRLEWNANYWARGLMHRLLEMVHQQWLYRNATVHMSLQDGLPSLPRGRRSTSLVVLAMLCARGTVAVVGRGCA